MLAIRFIRAAERACAAVGLYPVLAKCFVVSLRMSVKLDDNRMYVDIHHEHDITPKLNQAVGRLDCTVHTDNASASALSSTRERFMYEWQEGVTWALSSHLHLDFASPSRAASRSAKQGSSTMSTSSET